MTGPRVKRDYLAWAQLIALLALIASLVLHWLIRGTL